MLKCDRIINGTQSLVGTPCELILSVAHRLKLSQPNIWSALSGYKRMNWHSATFVTLNATTGPH